MVRTVSANQVHEDGKPINICDVIADETSPSPKRAQLDAERTKLVEEVLAGVAPDDRERAQAILTGEARSERLPEATRERLRHALAGVEDR